MSKLDNFCIPEAQTDQNTAWKINVKMKMFGLTSPHIFSKLA